MKGNFNDSFISSAGALNDVDADSDGFVSAYDCDDTNANINPFAIDDPTTSVDESCGSTLSIDKPELDELGFYVNSNPNNGSFSVISTHVEKYRAALFSLKGQLISQKSGIGVIEFKNIISAGVYLLRITIDGKLVGTSKIIVK